MKPITRLRNTDLKQAVDGFLLAWPFVKAALGAQDAWRETHGSLRELKLVLETSNDSIDAHAAKIWSSLGAKVFPILSPFAL